MLQIAHHWGRDPFWLYTLDKPTQIAVLADWRLTNETTKERKTEQDRLKNRLFKERLKKGG